MDSPWDEHPESTNALQELEWTKLSSEFTNAGYREGITAGKESALQEGFDQGFATAGVPIGKKLGQIRGIVSAILSSSSSSSSLDKPCLPTVPSETYHHHHHHHHHHQEIIAEIQEINSRLSRIRFSDVVVPPDLEAEEQQHARRHGNDLDVDSAESDGQELEGREMMERLEDMVERMNTDSEGADRRVGHVVKGRPMGGEEDLEALRNRLDQLAAQLGMDLNYA